MVNLVTNVCKAINKTCFKAVSMYKSPLGVHIDTGGVEVKLLITGRDNRIILFMCLKTSTSDGLCLHREK